MDAENPQASGGFYAWGETQEKSEYGISTYSHYDSTNRYHDLGKDISGSQYDVAHVKWGGDWRMPGDLAFQEILNYCTYEFVNINDVEGLKFTGTNGGSIFFPNAGFKKDTSIGYNGTYGYAWTSTVSTKYEPRVGASRVFFYVNENEDSEDRIYVNDLNRFLGFNVRPAQFSCDVNRDGNTDISDVVLVVNKILNGNVGYYSCPDNNHPHKIDLGLPSGTLWSCCNVGATLPRLSGHPFAWGETEIKDKYDETTYIHCDDQDLNKCHDLGDSIIGTEYDVAHVQWGGSWQMPSYTQADELIKNCESEWTQIDGVNGLKFTGRNGSSIFFPASGYINIYGYYTNGEGGWYWTGNCLPRDIKYAIIMTFKNSGSIQLGGYYRERGLFVRPVAK